MDTSTFRKLIKEHFKPELAVMGFKGSDHHFIKKSNEHYIYHLVIQASKYGGSCIMEMGVQLDFIEYKHQTINTYGCEFRKRIHQPITLIDRLLGNTSEKWHKYGNNEQQALKTIKKMESLIKTQGQDYYNQFVDFPNPLVNIKFEKFVEMKDEELSKLGIITKQRLALVLSKIHKFIGNKYEQHQFALWGIKNISQDSGLVDDFNKLIQDE